MGAFRRPESVLVLVYVDRSDVLLLRRVAPFDFWQSVTGSLDADEMPAETARRELHEETGLTAGRDLVDTGTSRVFTIDPRWRDRYAPGVTENTEYEFRLRLKSRCEIHIDSDEHSEFQWTDIDRAIDTVWSWTNRAALERLRAEL